MLWKRSEMGLQRLPGVQWPRHGSLQTMQPA